MIALLEDRRQALTQQAVAGAFGTSQANVSRVEARIDRERDIYLSTLGDDVEALGGRLEIAAVFPDATVVLTPSPRPGGASDGRDDEAGSQPSGADLRAARRR